MQDDLCAKKLLTVCTKLLESEEQIEEATRNKKPGLFKDQRKILSDILDLELSGAPTSMAPVVYSDETGSEAALTELEDEMGPDETELRLLHLDSGKRKVAHALPHREQNVLVARFPALIGKLNSDKYRGLLAKAELFGEITTVKDAAERMQRRNEAVRETEGPLPVSSVFFVVPIRHQTRSEGSMRDLVRPVSGVALDGVLAGVFLSYLRQKLGLEKINPSIDTRQLRRKFGAAVERVAPLASAGLEWVVPNLLQAGLEEFADGELEKAREEEIVFFGNTFLESVGLKPDYHRIDMRALKHAARFFTFEGPIEIPAGSKASFPTLRKYPAPPFPHPAYTGRNSETAKLLSSICLSTLKGLADGPEQHTELARRLDLAGDEVPDQERKRVANRVKKGREFIEIRDRWQDYANLCRPPMTR